ncbi:hypothetical protein Aoki45_15570 [Algoriphagus sp. oki45]|nr:hypothetical protein Aoki45_15570 [Algoriphagus sp. oki45]
MNKRKTYFFVFLILTCCVIFLLITGSPLLVYPLDKGGLIPLGTFITWIGMISLPFSVYWGAKELRQPTSRFNMILSVVLKLLILLGILWVPISYLLAGNLSFSFSEKEVFQGGQTAMKWFWRLSYGIGIGSCLVLISFFVSSLIFKKRN